MSFQELHHLPQTRRVVTGHSLEGKAIFEHDDLLTPVSLSTKVVESSEGLQTGFTLIHQAQDYPIQLQGGDSELLVGNLRRSKKGGILCEIVDVPPAMEKKDAYLHRNASLDYMVVLKGSIVCILDDGVETTLHEGDVLVQKCVIPKIYFAHFRLCPFYTSSYSNPIVHRGTMHGWKNVGQSYCRFLVVIVPSQLAKVETTGEYLSTSKIPGLTD